jgi:hypothetical protein
MTFARRALLLTSTFASAALAQGTTTTVVVTPGNQAALGWGPATATRTPFNGGTQAITATNPHSGNGSIELNLPAGSTRTGYGFGFTTLPMPMAADLCAAAAGCSRQGRLDELTQLSFDYFSPLSGASAPVFRLYFTLVNPGAVIPGTQNRFGSFIWTVDANTALAAGQWHTVNLLSQQVAFRPVFGSGQVGLNCANSPRTTNVASVSQLIATWQANCDGSGSNLDLRNAVVLGWDVGQGNDGNPDARVGFADNIAVGFNGNTTIYNFESQLNVVPEPGTYALLLTGLAGLAGTVRRRRTGASTNASA